MSPEESIKETPIKIVLSNKSDPNLEKVLVSEIENSARIDDPSDSDNQLPSFNATSTPMEVLDIPASLDVSTKTEVVEAKSDDIDSYDASASVNDNQITQQPNLKQLDTT